MRRVMVSFDTRPYFTSHLQEPRGRGGWAFDFGAGLCADGFENYLWVQGTYQEARKVAREFGRWLGQGLGETYLVAKVLP